VLDRAALRRDKLRQLGEWVRTYAGLLGLVVVVALFGVVNTMALSVVERVRELGLLRAVGMDRTQVRSMIRWESVIVAAIGAVLGVGLGTVLGWTVVRAFRDSGLDVFSFPLAQLVLLITLVSFLGTAAAALPARQAVKTDILDAIAVD
jgi:putative ABC transport system permease protein